MALENQAMETKDGTRLDSLTKHSGGWLENRDNELWKPWQSLGSGRDQVADDNLQFESTRASPQLVGMGL